MRGVSKESVAACSALVQRRSYIGFAFSSMHHWKLPYGGTKTNVTKEELSSQQFKTKSREQWNYQRVDDTINGFSEFRRMDQRPDFDGPRTEKVLYDTHTPGKYRLMDHFDEYTKAGSDRKYQAACAVKEQWDASESFYPGEQWRRNRPGFRSVPKELLNKQTWYHWIDTLTKWDEIQSTIRTRSFNPMWPPPGLKPPTLATSRREYMFGLDDPAVAAEADRFGWFQANLETNVRVGTPELIVSLLFGICFWIENRMRSRQIMYRSQMSGNWYPGRIFINPYGCIDNMDDPKDVYVWQAPIEEFSNQGEFWFYKQSRFAYINYLKRRDEQDAIDASL